MSTASTSKSNVDSGVDDVEMACYTHIHTNTDRQAHGHTDRQAHAHTDRQTGTCTA